MLLAIEGTSGAGKTTLRDRLLAALARDDVRVTHIGQFSWLSLPSTRVLLRLRDGDRSDDEQDAVTAVRRDLELHARHNLAPARAHGHLIADRLALSSACLLSLHYRRHPAAYLEDLAVLAEARPDTTIVLTTSPWLCQQRLASRTPTRRFQELDGNITRLAGLYEEAAQAWGELTASRVILRGSATHDDLELLVTACLMLLRTPTDPLPSGGPA